MHGNGLKHLEHWCTVVRCIEKELLKCESVNVKIKHLVKSNSRDYMLYYILFFVFFIFSHAQNVTGGSRNPLHPPETAFLPFNPSESVTFGTNLMDSNRFNEINCLYLSLPTGNDTIPRKTRKYEF